MFKLIKLGAGVLLLIVVLGALLNPSSNPSGSSGRPDQADRRTHNKGEADSNPSDLAHELSYLAGLPNVAWHEVEGNNVYIGLKERSEEDDLLVRLAAMRGHKKLGSGFHAWGIVGAKRGWRPGDSPNSTIEHTARYGKIED